MRKQKRENGLHKLLQDREVGSLEYYRSVKHRQILEMLPRDASDWLKKAIGDLVHNKVEELNLESNNICGYQVVQYPSKAMAEALKVNTALQVLSVRHHHISDEGGKALAEALKVNSALRVLDLECNHISDEGGKALAEVLKVNTALRALHLAHNNISDEGAKALTESLKVNKALQELYLHSNNISDAVKQQIVRELKKNCLETITVGCNKKPSVSDEILAEMEKVIISEAQKGNKIGTVRTYLVAYRKQAGVPESFRFPTGWVTNIHKEHFVEKPNDSPVKL